MSKPAPIPLHMKNMRFTLLSISCLLILPAFAETGASVVTKTPGLVAFWTFGEPSDQPRQSTGTPNPHPLTVVGDPITRADVGSYSGHSAQLNGKSYFEIPYAETKDLNISGSDAQVSMFAVVKVHDLHKSRNIAGLWSEGRGHGDDSGTRQYALLMNMPTYGGPNKLVPHISSEGGVTHRPDGTKFPWCADYAVSAAEVPTDEWCTLAFTYDSKYIRAYINGELSALELDPVKHKRNDPYFTEGGPDGKDRGINPYFHGRGIFTYDPEKHSKTKPIGGSDFVIGSRMANGNRFSEPTIGLFGGLAVFNRALSDAEILALHKSANIEKLNK